MAPKRQLHCTDRKLRKPIKRWKAKGVPIQGCSATSMLLHGQHCRTESPAIESRRIDAVWAERNLPARSQPPGECRALCFPNRPSQILPLKTVLENPTAVFRLKVKTQVYVTGARSRKFNSRRLDLRLFAREGGLGNKPAVRERPLSHTRNVRIAAFIETRRVGPPELRVFRARETVVGKKLNPAEI